MKRKLFAVAAACAALIATLPPASAADTYPSHPIRLITPAAPGGTTDFLARLMGTRLSEVLKEQVVVDNRASASGVIAADITAHSPPDGYTLFLGYHQHTVNAALNPNLPYKVVDDFTPITQLTAAGLLLLVNPSSPPKTLKEFVEWTQNFKGPLNFGSADTAFTTVFSALAQGTTPKPSPSVTPSPSPGDNDNTAPNSNRPPPPSPQPTIIRPGASPTPRPAASPNRNVNGGVLNGMALSLPRPVYPPIAKQIGASGEVRVQVAVDGNGNVVSARAVSGHPMLRAAAESAARQSRMKSEAANSTGQIVYNFRSN